MASITADFSSPLTRLSSAPNLKRTASVMLYNGVSNRSRGWKSKKPGDVDAGPESRLSRQPSIKKFDGAARSCAGWDHLRKDPDMWFRNGNCFVHLYEKGQSQRGAAFKVPFSYLIAARCQPMIERFVDRTVSEEEAYENGHVDLYIPAPFTATRSEALQYHISTRNFFAWVFRRSVVGDQLGTSLIGLLSTMKEWREDAADNLKDLLDYLDEEGYLDVRNQPAHALAILHLAEALQLKDLYVEAFAHCVGMSERLYKHSEYSRISVTSRKLIRRARVDMDFRLSRAGAMLGDLLHDELSEAHLGLSTGARVHLNRFRRYVHGFYTTKFGSFPPPPADQRCSTIFRPEAYREMLADFEALYEYLVDSKFTLSAVDSTPLVAQGGLCSLQSVHEFDIRHKFTPLENPLPLLPDLSKAKDPLRRRSISWFVGNGSLSSKDGKRRPEQRFAAEAALMRATNRSKTHLLENRLVLAYRQFEEDSVLAQHKGEAGVGPGDARKVRWLFIYAIYQTLRGCSLAPPEVRSSTGVSYHVAVSTRGLPPWQARHETRSASDVRARAGGGGKHRPLFPERGRSISAAPLLSPINSPGKNETTAIGLEIKPDIDYLALRQQKADPAEQAGRGRQLGKNADDGTSTPRSRSQSLTRNMSFRRSLNVFRSSSQKRDIVVVAPASPSRKLFSASKAAYHEIIVYGYGNGTNVAVEQSADAGPPAMASSLAVAAGDTQSQPKSALPHLSVNTNFSASRSASTSSATSYNSSASISTSSTAAQSHMSSSTTPTTLIDPLSPAVAYSGQMSNPWKCADFVSLPNTHFQADEINYLDELNPSPVDYDNLTYPLRRQMTRKPLRAMYSNDDMLSAASIAEPPPLPRRSSRRSMRRSTLDSGPTNKRWSLADVVMELRENDESDLEDRSEAGGFLQPRPLRIRKSSAQLPNYSMELTTPAKEDDVFRSSGDWEKALGSMMDVSPPWTWEQFNDLGGLQPIHSLN